PPTAACCRCLQDSELVAKSAAESVYSGLGEGEISQKWAGIWGNFGLCRCGSQTVGVFRMRIVSTTSQHARCAYNLYRFRRQKGNSGKEAERGDMKKLSCKDPVQRGALA